jgi:hypothetical protein
MRCICNLHYASIAIEAWWCDQGMLPRFVTRAYSYARWIHRAFLVPADLDNEVLGSGEYLLGVALTDRSI